MAQGSTPAEHIRDAAHHRRALDIALALRSQATLAQSDASAAAKTTSYLPSISDFMIATIQPRHVRLWVAAHSKDWPFAAYEVGNLRALSVASARLIL